MLVSNSNDNYLRKWRNVSRPTQGQYFMTHEEHHTPLSTPFRVLLVNDVTSQLRNHDYNIKLNLVCSLL